MKRKCIKLIACLVILNIFLVCILIFREYKYREVAGEYAIDTLNILYVDVCGVIDKYENSQLNEKERYEIFNDLNKTVSYIQISPILNFLDYPISEMADYIVEDTNSQNIENLKRLKEDLKLLIEEINDNSCKSNGGIKTFNFFLKQENIQKTKGYFVFN